MIAAIVWLWLWLYEAKDVAVDAAIRALCFVFFWRHRIVPAAETGAPMLRQFALIRGGSWLGKRYGALYLQHFLTPESARFAHVHRWNRMRSIVLSGAFIEERFGAAAEGRGSELVAHIAGERYEMDHSVIHRVAWWGKRCWTLFHMSAEQSDDWGYYPIVGPAAARRLEGSLIPWRKHIVRRVVSLDTGKITQ